MFKTKTEIKNTMSREEYEKTLKSLQDQIEELKKVKVVDNKPKKGEIWKPKNGDAFCYIDDKGSPCYDECLCDCDSEIVEQGNYYKTIDEARFMSNVQKYTNLFRKYVEEHSEPLDWRNEFQDKYYIFYDYYKHRISHCSDFWQKGQGCIYSHSFVVLQDAIKFVGEDNVKKYVLGIDENK